MKLSTSGLFFALILCQALATPPALAIDCSYVDYRYWRCNVGGDICAPCNQPVGFCTPIAYAEKLGNQCLFCPGPCDLSTYIVDDSHFEVLESAIDYLVPESRERLAGHVQQNPLLVTLALALVSAPLEDQPRFSLSGVGSNSALAFADYQSAAALLRDFVAQASARSEIAVDTYYEVSGTRSESAFSAHVDFRDTSLEDFLGPNAKIAAFKITGKRVVDKEGNPGIALRIHPVGSRLSGR